MTVEFSLTSLVINTTSYVHFVKFYFDFQSFYFDSEPIDPAKFWISLFLNNLSTTKDGTNLITWELQSII